MCTCYSTLKCNVISMVVVTLVLGLVTLWSVPLTIS